jgi:hypothetical protein
MTIRAFRPGDEAAQVGIYNEACASLPKFKPATLDEIRRRCRAAEFDPGSRFFALLENKPVGYASFHANGLVSYPWCRPGQEAWAEPLFECVLEAMRQRGLTKAFAAYRGDWTAQQEFFEAHGFCLAREMVNFWLDPADMPTPAAQRSLPVSPLRREDIPAVFALAPQALRVSSSAELEQHLLHNPFFSAEDVFVLRDRSQSTILAAGILVANQAYADPKQLDAAMPCFRLGAFGTEGMQTKRVNGLFSLLAPDNQDVNSVGQALLGHAAFRLHRTEAAAFAAQVPSDVPHLLRFYQHRFRRQGSFPVLERVL